LVQVICGTTSTAAVSSDGDMFVWGNNAGNMLGLDSSEAQVLLPQQLDGVGRAVSAALGAMHGLAVVRV
jgi:alpha-tubulin suppressor-like RCC1 family protein